MGLPVTNTITIADRNEQALCHKGRAFKVGIGGKCKKWGTVMGNGQKEDVMPQHAAKKAERRTSTRLRSEATARQDAERRRERANYLGNRSVTRERSSLSSFTVASILPRLNSATGKPCTISRFFPLLRTGNEQINPFSMP